MIVVVLCLGFSWDMGGAGSVYFRVVRSAKTKWESLSERSGFPFSECGITILAFNLNPNIEIYSHNNQVAENVAQSDKVQCIRVVEWNTFSNLHEAENQSQVCSINASAANSPHFSPVVLSFIFLWEAQHD